VKPISKIRRGLAFITGGDNSEYPLTARLRIICRAVMNLLLQRNRAYRPAETSDGAFLKQLDGFKTLGDFCAHLRRREKPIFFTLTDREAKTSYEKLYPQSRQKVLAAADQILDHIFNLLGSGPKKLSAGARRDNYKSIDWHRDFKSGYIWDKSTYYQDVQYGWQAGVDVKVPWELSRCQHFSTLGKAYWLTGDEKYAREFVNQVEDWIASNPVTRGVNWACTMDVAIRAVNWLWGFYFFRNSPAVGDEFLGKFVKSLYAHGQFIIANLEKDPLGRHSNHYLSDLAGLAYLGVMLPEIKESRQWRDYAVKEIIAEAKRQVYPDGADYEGSISYHRLVVEIFLSVTLACRDNGISFPKWYWERLEKMLEFVMYYTKPDGKAPQIGDNDDGRLYILADYENPDRTDHRYLLAIGAALFNRTDFKRAAGGFSEEAFWLQGGRGKRQYEALGTPELSATSRAFVNSGYYVMRKDNLYLIMDCLNTNPKAPSGHRHNSRLSFELYAGDKTFIIDPGTYLYTPAPVERNLFRSTAYHNTVVVDGEEQNRINTGNLFQIGQEACIKVNRWQVTSDYAILDVEHDGYKKLDKPVVHRRQVFFNKREGYWIIRDILTGEGNHRFDLYFHFAPLEVVIDKDFPLAVRTVSAGANLAIIPLEISGITVTVEKGWVSHRYGVKTEAPIVKYSGNGQMPLIFGNMLYPYKTKIAINAVLAKAKEIDLRGYFGGKA
jgi:Heparinase II/III N-terminus/Heparinase II/III-like protein